MKLIVGLGNPGPTYEKTRHNVGFFFIDLLAEKFQISVSKNKFSSLIGEGMINSHKVLLAKPQTYMNLSGVAVKEILSFFKLDHSNLLVIHDELDLPLGEFKKKNSGGDAGHKGIRSIAENLGTRDFTRLRIGIGKPEIKKGAADYVLSPFKAEEIILLKNLSPAVLDSLEDNFN